jgi:hypothetical protein
MIRARFLIAATGLLVSAAAAAKNPAASIELATNSPTEQRAKDQLERLFKEHDLSRWSFTKKIRIEERARPHSHPVLTLNTRHVANDGLALSGFVHEQIHWFLAGKPKDFRKALADVNVLYPDAPEALAAGGSGTRQSTLLHLLVGALELESMRALLGREQGTAVIRDVLADAQSGGLGYHWIYQKVLKDQDKLSALVRQHKLALPGVP